MSSIITAVKCLHENDSETANMTAMTMTEPQHNFFVLYENNLRHNTTFSFSTKTADATKQPFRSLRKQATPQHNLFVLYENSRRHKTTFSFYAKNSQRHIKTFSFSTKTDDATTQLFRSLRKQPS